VAALWCTKPLRTFARHALPQDTHDTHIDETVTRQGLPLACFVTHCNTLQHTTTGPASGVHRHCQIVVALCIQLMYSTYVFEWLRRVGSCSWALYRYAYAHRGGLATYTYAVVVLHLGRSLWLAVACGLLLLPRQIVHCLMHHGTQDGVANEAPRHRRGGDTTSAPS